MKDERNIENEENKEESQVTWLPICMCLGLSIGMGIGRLLFDSMAIGMCMGMSLGVAVGSAIDAKNRADKGNPDENEKEQ